MFVRRCLPSESMLVKSVANYGVFCGCIASEFAHNVQTCCEYFAWTKSSLLGIMPLSCLSDMLSICTVNSHSLLRRSVVHLPQ